jgi:YebC/PmpR family DNA-binding regulatory protein
MSGHSKWAQIKRQKGAADQKRGATFSKLSNLITLAARNGSDPNMNFQLRMAVDQAKAANMPNDNIKRAIERATGVGANALENILFEAYGSGGIAFLIESATDNRNRATSEIRAILNKYDGKLAQAGSVAYLFRQRGLLTYEVEQSKVEELELSAIEAGADDVCQEQIGVFVYTNPKELDQVRQYLEGVGFKSANLELIWEPISTITVDKEKADKLITVSQLLEDLDDVTRVFSNFEIDQ